MKQFYRVEVSSKGDTVFQFEAPVRKMVVTANRSLHMFLNYSNKTKSARFYVPLNVPIYIDFQSANGGKGCTSIGLSSVTPDTSTVCFISIVEYGSDGDNDWYK